MTKPTIEIQPRSALTDVPVTIILKGLPPSTRVTLRARTMDDDFSRLWESWAVYEVSPDGTLDLSRVAPFDGSYQGTDPMGLIWAMELDPAAEEECYFRKSDFSPMRVRISAEVDGHQVASESVERLFISPGVRRGEVHQDGLRGQFFRPEGEGPFPGILVLGGGDGGIRPHGAALLASRGYAALALAYFKAEGLPDASMDIDLEYFGRALSWLGCADGVDPNRLAISGTSLGGMYALLVASHYPQVRVVVGYAPMGFVACINGRSPATWQGKPLQCISMGQFTPAEEEQFQQAVQNRQAISIAHLHLRSLEQRGSSRDGDIPVERINGSVLLISGEDDGLLPSTALSEMIIDRLEAAGSPHRYRHIPYPEAGHSIGLPHAHGLPFVPTYGCAPANPEGPLLVFGGTKRGNAYANTGSWAQLLGFLKENL